MTQNLKAPKLRFPGFTDDWEQRKLIEYLDVSKVKNKDEAYRKEDVLSVSGDYGIVNQIEFQGRSFAGVSVAPYGVVETGDVVYTKSPLKSNPYGIIKTNKGKTGIVSTLYAIYKPKKFTDSKFVQVYFEQDTRMNNYMAPLVNKGSKNDMKVSDENALKGDVIFPGFDEQKKISAYFEQLDNLITLHQRKFETLKKLKKGFLQKMFPKNGESVPEIRFPGFPDAWEQRKVGDLISESKEKGHTGNVSKKLTVKLWGKGVIAKDDKGSSNTQYFIRHKRQFIYSKLDFLNSAFGVIPDELEGFESTIDLPAFDCKDIAPFFLFCTATQPEFYLKNGMSANGSRKAKRINQDVFLNMPINVPSMDEQIKVCNFFKSLDNIITLHQRKLDTLKKLKQGMLQQMFI